MGFLSNSQGKREALRTLENFRVWAIKQVKMGRKLSPRQLLEEYARKYKGCWCCKKQPNPKCKCNFVTIDHKVLPLEQYCRTHKKWERG